MFRAMALLIAAAALLGAQPKRVLYVTHSAGFRHDCIPLSAQILAQTGRESGAFELVHTEEASAVTAENLARYDAVFFYTSGELPFSAEQKRALLNFVNRGGGFGGAHSATDTLYSWAEYGELIGGYFNGHPWAQEVRIDVEDPDHPAAAHLARGFRVVEEIYQFRNLSRDRVRVLMTLDTSTVNLAAEGVNANTTDFPLAWTRTQGSGRVFYTALGHFEDTWRNPQFQRTLLGAIRWITRQVDAPGEPRPARGPEVRAVSNSATGVPAGTIAPGSLISIYGANLTPGSSSDAEYVSKLAGATVSIGGTPARLIFASSGQINALVPETLGPGTSDVRVTAAGLSSTAAVQVASATPGIFAVTTQPGAITIWATGFRPDARLTATVGGASAQVLFSGISPQWPGLNQVNVAIPAAVGRGAQPVELQIGDGAAAVARATVTLP